MHNLSTGNEASGEAFSEAKVDAFGEAFLVESCVKINVGSTN